MTNQSDHNNNTYQEELHEAAFDGSPDRIKYLVEKGADVNRNDPSMLGFSPLYCAIHSNPDLEVARALIECGADVNGRDEMGRTPLYSAADGSVGDIERIELLLERGAALNMKDNEGTTPLHIAAQNYVSEIALCLLKHGAEVNARDNDGNTPLHDAVHHQNREVSAILIKYGADKNARNIRGDTPCSLAEEMAERMGLPEFYGEILHIERETARRGLPEHQKSSKGNASSMKSSSSAFCFQIDTISINTTNSTTEHARRIDLPPSKVRNLTYRVLPFDGKRIDNGHALSRALLTGYDFAHIKKMLANGADLNITTDLGMTPLHIAAMQGNLDICKLLVEAGAETNVQNANLAELTPLHAAAYNGHADICCYLISRGADANFDGARDELASPLRTAAREGHNEVLVILMLLGGYHADRARWYRIVDDLYKFNYRWVTAFKDTCESASFSTPLVLAATLGLHAACKELLACGADASQVDLNATPVYLAEKISIDKDDFPAGLVDDSATRKIFDRFS